MSSPRITVFQKALNIFRRTRESQAKEVKKFIGEDHLGNKYYEVNKAAHMRPIQRYFERPRVASFDDVVEAANVPPLWDAWLRFRRQEPPTKEEVQESIDYYKMQQEMAARKKMEAGVDKNPKVPKPRSIPPDQYIR